MAVRSVLHQTKSSSASPTVSKQKPSLLNNPYLATVLLMWLLAAGLLLLFHARQNNNREFTGIIGSRESGWVCSDSAVYLDMIHQAKDGAWLLQNRFTSEIASPRYLNTIWVLLGKIAAIARLSPIAIFTIFRFIAIALFVFALRQLLNVTIKWKSARSLALFLIVFCGGIGWIFAVLGHGSLFLECRKSEAGCFLPLLTSPHLTLSMALMFWSFAGLATSATSRKFCWKTPLLVLFLTSFHPFDTVVVLATAGVYIALLKLRDGKLNRPLLYTYLAAIALAMPIIAYQAWSLTTSPDLRGQLFQNNQFPQSSIRYLLAVMPLGILALYQMCTRIANYKTASTDQLLIPAWALTLPVIVFAYPEISFSRKLAIAMSVPIYILAADWMGNKLRFWDSGLSLRTILRTLGPAVSAGIVLSLCSSVMVIALIARTAIMRSEPFYTNTGVVKAMRWLEKQPNADATVLSTMATGAQLPVLADKRAFLGHGIMTVDYLNKQEFARTSFQNGRLPDEVLHRFEHYGIRWVFYGNNERKWWKTLQSSDHLQLAYNDNKVQVYKVIYDHP